MEVAQQANKKVKTTNRGTCPRAFPTESEGVAAVEPSKPEDILSQLTRFNPKLPKDGWKEMVRVEKTESVTMNVVNQASLEPS